MKLSLERAAACGLSLIVMSALVFGSMPASGQEEAPEAGKVSAPFKLAVVDLDEVLTQSEEWSDYLDESQRLQEKMRRTLEKYERQLRILRSEYENLPPGTDLAGEKQRQLENALRQYRESRNEFEEQLRKQRVESLSKLFNQINEIVKRYAEENDIDLILKRQKLDVSPRQPLELGVVVTTAQVLYARERYDVTDAIVRELNARYPGEIKER